MSDYKGAALILDVVPKARTMIPDRGYDADWLRHALTAPGIEPCIPSKSNRKVPIPYKRAFYRQRHPIKNMFGKLKGRRPAVSGEAFAHSALTEDVVVEQDKLLWADAAILKGWVDRVYSYGFVYGVGEDSDWRICEASAISRSAVPTNERRTGKLALIAGLDSNKSSAFPK